MASQREDLVHEMVATYLQRAYPSVIFTSEPSGLFTRSWNQRRKLKILRSNHKLPDLWVLHPHDIYHGLLLELKDESVTILKKNGELRKNEHLHEQYRTIKSLRDLGYCANFAIGVDHAVAQIDAYMKGEDMASFFIEPRPLLDHHPTNEVHQHEQT